LRLDSTNCPLNGLQTEPLRAAEWPRAGLSCSGEPWLPNDPQAETEPEPSGLVCGSDAAPLHARGVRADRREPPAGLHRTLDRPVAAASTPTGAAPQRQPRRRKQAESFGHVLQRDCLRRQRRLVEHRRRENHAVTPCACRRSVRSPSSARSRAVAARCGREHMQYATCNMQHRPCNMQLATYNMQQRAASRSSARLHAVVAQS
jgi:hypothetical protein